MEGLIVLLTIFVRVSGQTTSSVGVTGTTGIAGNDSSTTSVLSTSPTFTPATVLPTLAPADFPASQIPANTDLAFCVCDLSWAKCDINCCCDDDCTDADRLVFSGCSDAVPSDPLESRLCSYSVNVFKDNSVTEETVNNPNLFCLWRDRNSARNFYTVTDLAKTNTQYNDLAAQADSSFSYQYQTIGTSSSDDNVYKSNQVLVTMAASQRRVLTVPGSIASSSTCLDTNPAQFLRDSSAYCSRDLSANLAVTCETTDSINALRYRQNLQDQRLLATPSSVGGLVIRRTGGLDTPVFNSSAKICSKVLTQVDYVIEHKSGVIITIDVTITSSDLPAELISVQQLYTMTYKDVSASVDSFSRSGNPGYIVGKPILAGVRVENFVALSGDSEQYLTMVTGSASGDCITDSLNRRQVLFGENFRSGCLIKSTSSDLTDRCDYIQSHVIEALLGPTRTIAVDGTLYIASFGNSNPLKIGDWVEVLITNEVLEGSCKGVAMHLEVLYANHGAHDNPQARIIGAKLTFEPIELEFMCVGSYCQTYSQEQVQKFEMVTSVAFVDVTSAPEQAFAAKPAVRSKLPANFFHPYYISNSSSQNGISCSMFILMSSLFSIFIVY